MKKLMALALCLMLLLPAAVQAEETADRLPDEVLMQYYDHSLFVGDSVIRMFRNYVKNVQKTDPGYFPGIKFYSEYSYQLHTAAMQYVTEDRVNLKYKGSDATLSEIMKGEKPEKVFILAGLNERIHLHIDWADSYITKIMAIRDKYSPDTEMYFFSLTPVTRKVGNPRQEKHDEYNVWLARKCEEVGATYIEISELLKDEDGFMRKSISSDGEYHLNAEGNAIWAQKLLDFAQEQYDLGLWTPAE